MSLTIFSFTTRNNLLLFVFFASISSVRIHYLFNLLIFSCIIDRLQKLKNWFSHTVCKFRILEFVKLFKFSVKFFYFFLQDISLSWKTHVWNRMNGDYQRPTILFSNTLHCTMGWTGGRLYFFGFFYDVYYLINS